MFHRLRLRRVPGPVRRHGAGPQHAIHLGLLSQDRTHWHPRALADDTRRTVRHDVGEALLAADRHQRGRGGVWNRIRPRQLQPASVAVCVDAGSPGRSRDVFVVRAHDGRGTNVVRQTPRLRNGYHDRWYRRGRDVLASGLARAHHPRRVQERDAHLRVYVRRARRGRWVCLAL